MKRFVSSTLVGLVCTASAVFAQHAQVSSVAVNPANPSEVWVCNRGNDSVSVINTATGVATHEIAVGVWPRSLAFSPDGSKVYVANQRGNVPVDVNFVTPFTGTEIRGTVSVINVASKTVASTLTNVGTEPYGVAFAPNGKYFVVSGFRSGTLKFYNASNNALLYTLQFPWDMNFISSGTVLDVDSNEDMIPDLAEPRAFVIRGDSSKIYVTHLTGGFVSTIDVTLRGGGMPAAAFLGSRIDLNTYTPHPIMNPVDVQVVASQGTPRFLDDIALAPDGTRALVPHVLHNINHDVNFDFGGAIAGAFANRVYPAVTVVDTALDSYAAVGDASARLHHELADNPDPAAYVPFGPQGVDSGLGVYTLGGSGAPVLGGTATFVHSGHNNATDLVFMAFGVPTSIPLGALGTLLNLGNYGIFAMTPSGPNAVFSAPIANNPTWEGASLFFQSAVISNTTAALKGFSNGVEVVLSATGPGAGKMGHRAGHPSRVAYSPTGSHAVVLNRGSEDVFLYKVAGSTLTLTTAFPPRHDFAERAPFDATAPMGDLPLGMALKADATTSNDDALLYIVNESSSTLSVLRIDFATGTITKEHAQIPTLLGPDQMTVSERRGEEIFEDASRAQCAGNFNNSCASCHFEGGADGNIWQRPAGPRTTMPVYGGTLLTGLILWKGVRLNMGETGPMFGGENGGHGIFGDAEQQALIDYHEIIPTPLNPHLDPVTGDYSDLAAEGKDLFFGTNLTGKNPIGRSAGCFNCHPDKDAQTLEVRGYTTDFLDPQLTQDPLGLELLDPTCFTLQENLVMTNIRDVNSGVNIDLDGDGFPEVDRNGDGYSDLETYAVLNKDTSDDFTRDDANSWPCPETGIPGDPQKLFARGAEFFSVPTKLAVYSTGPYFHDHSAASLRTLLDPGSQQLDPVYGNPSYPSIQKFFNEFHDIRGHQDLAPGSSKVQTSLQTIAAGSTFEADIDAILAYIASL